MWSARHALPCAWSWHKGLSVSAHRVSLKEICLKSKRLREWTTRHRELMSVKRQCKRKGYTESYKRPDNWFVAMQKRHMPLHGKRGGRYHLGRSQVWFVKNGVAELSKVTGTGCMLNVITATYLSVTDPLTACLLSAGTLGICGELADKSRGMGTYHIELINQLSTLSDAQLEQYLQIQRAL